MLPRILMGIYKSAKLRENVVVCLVIFFTETTLRYLIKKDVPCFSWLCIILSNLRDMLFRVLLVAVVRFDRVVLYMYSTYYFQNNAGTQVGG
jgi:hypothetical protein